MKLERTRGGWLKCICKGRGKTNGVYRKVLVLSVVGVWRANYHAITQERHPASETRCDAS